MSGIGNSKTSWTYFEVIGASFLRGTHDPWDVMESEA